MGTQPYTAKKQHGAVASAASADQGRSSVASAWLSMHRCWRRRPRSLRTLESTRKLAVNVAALAAIALAGLIVVQTTFVRRYVIDPLNVPKQFEERGYTGPVVARRILDEIQVINRLSRTTMQRGVFSPASLQGLVPQIELGGAGLSVATVVGSLRRALGITDAEINGEIVVASGPGRDTDLYSVHIRVDIDGGQEATASAQSIENADELFAFAARRIVEQATPYVAASYYYYYLQKETAAGSAERDRYLALAERMIVTCVNSGDAELVARATNLRGVIAQYVRKDPVEAVARFRQVARGTKAYPASRYNLAEAYRAHALDWRRRIDGEARVRELAEAKAPALEGVAADYSRSSQSTGYYITGSVSLALAQLSIRRARQHHYLAALRYFDLSLEENPQRADAYRAQADALISIRQDFGAAVPACERAVELGDAQVLCYSVLANHYLRSGSVWKAIEVQRRVREMFPRNQELQRDLSS